MTGFETITPDHELLTRTCAGDAHAAREFWSRFAPRLTAFAGALLHRHGGQTAAADIIQQVFCRLLELRRTAVAEIGDVPAFLTASVRHAAMNHIRSSSRELRRRERTALTLHRAEANDSADDLRVAIDTLPEDLRELVLLKHVAGLTFDQIAVSLGENRNTLASRYRKALELLQTALSPVDRGSALHTRRSEVPS